MRATWRDDRAVLVLLAVASAGYWLAWGPRSRPMGDSPAYRLAAQVVTGGWDQLTDRAPGYPLVLWATGSARSETVALFAAQLLMHAGAVWLAVDLARRFGVGARLRLLLAVLLLFPPVVMKAAYAGSEATTELLVVGVVWLLVRWWDRREPSVLLATGGALGALALVRPTYQLLVVPLALLVWWMGRPARPLVAVARLATPAVLIIGAVVLANGVRFGSPALTPLLPWHLSVKTALFVEELPASEEPVRSFLVAERDALLVAHPEHVAATYAFDNRDELAAMTGRTGPDLDRYVLGLNLRLVAAHPLRYAESVVQASARYVQLDAQPAGFGGTAVLGWAMVGLHALVAAGVLGVALVMPGVVALRGIDRRRAWLLATAGIVILSTAAVSVLLETGSARLRSPTDPLIVLLAVVAGQYLGENLERRRALRGTGRAS